MRYNFIDVYRGLAIALMVFFNFLPLFAISTPFILLHNQGSVLLPGDLVAPMFQFLIGVGIVLSVEGRRAKGQTHSQIAQNILRRFAYIFLLGILLDAGAYLTLPTWGVLEALASAGIIAFLLYGMSSTIVLATAFTLWFVYAMFSLSPSFVSMLTALPHGGPFGIISWTPITLIGLLAGKSLLRKQTQNLFYSSLFLLAFGFAVSLAIPFNKFIVSSSYSIFAAGFTLLLFYSFGKFEKYLLFQPLLDFGKNALLAWTMQFLLVFYPLYYILHKTQFLQFELAAAVSLILLIIFWLVVKFSPKLSFA